MAISETDIVPVLKLGPVEITSTVIITWIIMAVLAILAILVTRRLKADPGPLQTAIEGIVTTIENAVTAVAPGHASAILPFIGSLWIFLVVANLVGLIPGAHSPTSDLSTTAALAILVFLSVHWYGIRISGLKAYARHYLEHGLLLLPFNIISEITRTFALAIRLFGNIMSLEMAALLILMVAGFLAPVPILMLHVVEALVQAYIFGMLALIYVAGGIQSQQIQTPTKGEIHG